MAAVAENFQAVQTALELSQQDIYRLAKNSFEATFLNSNEKQALIAELDQFMATAESAP